MKIMNKGVVLDGGMYYYWDGRNDGMMAKVMMRGYDDAEYYVYDYVTSDVWIALHLFTYNFGSKMEL